MRSSPHADPARGVFETLLVLDGEAVEVDAHMRRLTDSLAALFGVDLPGDANSRVADRARPLRRGRLRLTAIPSVVGSVEISVSTAEVEEADLFPPAVRGIALRTVVVEGGLGAHKWVDRSLLDRLGASIKADEVPLLLDARDEVLEASRANVFAVRDGALLTPPADGRIVPGIARRHILELARAVGREVREDRLRLEDLLAADEVFLTNSVRGIEPVRSIDDRDVRLVGGAYSTSGTSGAELSNALRRRWLQVPQGGPAAVVSAGRRAGRPSR